MRCVQQEQKNKMVTYKDSGFKLDSATFKVKSMLQTKPAIYEVVKRYCETEARNAQNLKFLEAVHEGGDPTDIAQRFVLRGSSDEINIPDTMRAPVLESLGLTNPPDNEAEKYGIELIDDFQDGDDEFEEMTRDDGSTTAEAQPREFAMADNTHGIFSELFREVTALVDRTIQGDFERSATFEAHCRSKLGDPGKAAATLGLNANGDVQTLVQFMAALAAEDKVSVRTIGGALSKIVQMPLKDIVAAIRSSDDRSSREAPEAEDAGQAQEAAAASKIALPAKAIKAVAQVLGEDGGIEAAQALAHKIVERLTDAKGVPWSQDLADTLLLEARQLRVQLDDEDDEDDPFPEPQRETRPRAPDPFPDDGPVGLSLNDQTGDTAEERFAEVFWVHVSRVAEALSAQDFNGAGKLAKAGEAQLRKLGGDNRMTAKLLMSKAAEQSKAARKGGGRTLARVLTMKHAQSADWKTFSKIYGIAEDEDLAACKEIAVGIAKKGQDAPAVLILGKAFAEKWKKNKKAKFKFKNKFHVVGAIEQLMRLKAESQKLKKKMKASEVPDEVGAEDGVKV